MPDEVLELFGAHTNVDLVGEPDPDLVHSILEESLIAGLSAVYWAGKAAQ
jgi:hypothetical protein